MNFKVFRTAHNGNKEASISNETISFLDELDKAICDDSTDSFISNIFDNYELHYIINSFVEFVENCRTDRFEGTFFTVCDAICRNVSHLDNREAILLISSVTTKYYDYEIYTTREANGNSFFGYLMSHLPATLLERVVWMNFRNIAKDLYFEDLKYLGTYTSWRNEIPKYFESFMELMDDDFKNYMYFAEFYPELAPAVYEYVLEIMLGRSTKHFDLILDEDFDLINDFLKPMSELEKYQGYYFASVREYAEEILDYPGKYAVMYDVGNFLIENFNISPNVINKVIDDCSDYLIYDISQKLSTNDDKALFGESYNVYETLNDFFASERAYNRFMNKLPILLMNCGIVLYAVLLRLLGPVFELTESEGICREYIMEIPEVSISLKA